MKELLFLNGWPREWPSLCICGLLLSVCLLIFSLFSYFAPVPANGCLSLHRVPCGNCGSGLVHWHQPLQVFSFPKWWCLEKIRWKNIQVWRSFHEIFNRYCLWSWMSSPAIYRYCLCPRGLLTVSECDSVWSLCKFHAAKIYGHWNKALLGLVSYFIWHSGHCVNVSIQTVRDSFVTWFSVAKVCPIILLHAKETPYSHT